MNTQILVLQPWDDGMPSYAFLVHHSNKTSDVYTAYQKALDEAEKPIDFPDGIIANMKEDGWQMVPLGFPTIVRY